MGFLLRILDGMTGRRLAWSIAEALLFSGSAAVGIRALRRGRLKKDQRDGGAEAR